jgi:hypothetical protein
MMMIPVLKRGDRVHIAVPTGTGMFDNEQRTRVYAREGVTVVLTTVVRGLDRPTIVAIFRDGD